jgi:hypothetical protein
MTVGHPSTKLEKSESDMQREQRATVPKRGPELDRLDDVRRKVFYILTIVIYHIVMYHIV